MTAITIDVGVTAGATDHDNLRLVDNNRVMGLQTVSSDFDGTFVAPEVSISTQTKLGAITLQPTLRVGYAGLYLDSHTETGSTAPLSVDERDIHMVHARLELAALMSSSGPDALMFYFSPYIGIDGRSLVDVKMSTPSCSART